MLDRDRTLRLTLAGLLTVGMGVLCLGLALLHLALPWVLEALPASAAAELPDRAALAMGLLLYGTLGCLLIVIGLGAIRRRRWAPALLRVLAWIWLVCGALTLGFVWLVLDELLGLAAPDAAALPPEAAAFVRIVVLGGTAVFGLLVPALLVWVSRDPLVARLCAAWDPRPGPLDRIPPPLLTLGLGLALAALLTLPLALRPVVPLFGVWVGGMPGLLATLGLAAACAGLAFATWRGAPIGWWGTTLLLLVLGGSVMLTLQRADPAELYRALGYPESRLAAIPAGGGAARRASLWLTAGLTVVSVAYMLAIRRHFRPTAAKPPDPGS